MDTSGALLFLLAPPEALSSGPLDSAAITRMQTQGVVAAFALRIISTGDLAGEFQRVCDTITPRFETERLWLGVYSQSESQPQPAPDAPPSPGNGPWRQLDCFPLSQARNETCWFYPTTDGHYLSWRRELAATLGPGRVVDPSPHSPDSYNRAEVALLWSLLADDSRLTCVGVTYGGRRIEWPLQERHWAETAQWSEFSVNSQRNPSLLVHSCRSATAKAT
jgi:hypothetical protein